MKKLDTNSFHFKRIYGKIMENPKEIKETGLTILQK